MKICIYQVAFIVAIFSISKSLYCRRNEHSVKHQNEIISLATSIKNSIDDFMKEAGDIDRLHRKTSKMDSKDKSTPGVYRSKVKRAQSFSSSGINQKDRQVAQTLHYLKKTKEQIDSATHLMAGSNESTKAALAEIPKITV